MFKKKVDILIFVEHRSRELESAALLKVLFERKGYTVAVESLQFNRELVMLMYYPKFVIVPWVYTEREVAIWSFLNMGRKNDPIALLNMHHEQLTNTGSMNTLLPQGRAKDTYHLCWGDQFAEQLISVGCKKELLLCSGNIRLDFYKKSLRGMTISKDTIYQKYCFESGKRIVLFIGNAFHLFKPDEVKQILDRGVDMEEQREKSIVCRRDFLKYTDKYLNENDDTIFVYRPHPCHDSREIMQNDIQYLLKKYPARFYCISDGPIRDWILNSDVCVSFHSTSAIECDLADVPFYLMRTVPLSPDKDYKFFENYPYVIKDYTSFLNAIGTYKQDFEVLEEQLKKELYLTQSKLFASDLVEGVDSEYKKNSVLTFNVLPNYFTCVNSFCRLIVKHLIYIIGQIPFIRKMIVEYNSGKTFNPLRIGADYWRQDELIAICENISFLLNKERTLAK